MLDVKGKTQAQSGVACAKIHDSKQIYYATQLQFQPLPET